MPRFFVAGDAIADGRVTIAGADAHHLARSLRARPGERIVVADDGGREHGVVLDNVTETRVEGSVEWTRTSTGEPRCRVSVLQALLKEGMDAAVEGLVEAGVAEIWPVATERTVARLDERRAAVRAERWQTIAREAAGLAGRAAPPPVHRLMSLADALAAIPPAAQILALTTASSTPLSGFSVAQDAVLAMVVGPEGGLGRQDQALLSGAGAIEVHLGPRVLRSRLAGVVALGVILARSGDLSDPVPRAPLTVVHV